MSNFSVPPPPAPQSGMANVVEEPITAPLYTVSPETVSDGAVKKRHKRLNPDSYWTLGLAVFLVFSLIATSFIASFAAIYEVAEYTGVSQDWRWVFPVFIDAAITAYTISLFIFRARRSSIVMTILGLLMFSALSIAANVAHVLAYWDGTLPDYRAWIGVALAAAAPIGVLMASEEIARLAFVSPEEGD